MKWEGSARDNNALVEEWHSSPDYHMKKCSNSSFNTEEFQSQSLSLEWIMKTKANC